MVIKIVSLNMWLGGILMDDLLDFLKYQDADIVALQEVYNGTDGSLERQYRSMEILKKALGYPYENFAPDFRDYERTNGKAVRGNAILSKFPILSYDVTYFGAPYSESAYRDVPGNYHNCPRNLQHVVLDTVAGNVDVYNIQGVWDLDGDNYSEPRKNMSKTVLSAVKEKANVILMGDTNAKPGNKAIKAVEQELKSVFEDSVTSTFNMRRKDNPGYATAAVDMVFVSKNIEIIDRKCDDVDISDHLPVSAVLSFGG